MPQEKPKRAPDRQTIIWLLVELAVYSVFVFLYFMLALHFWGGWIKHLFDTHKALYAIVALGLMAGQAVLLELVTSGLFRLIRGKT